MSATIDSAGPVRPVPAPLLFAVTVFVSAGLVFIVQPMVARMLLPRLGGSAAVWNTSLAFFQAALLLGYAYAHALQRLRSVRRQMALHLGVLLAAAATLPLRVTDLLGPPSASSPVAWLVAVLALSLGAPFAALSATAPLLQSWHARLHSGAGPDPYRLYAASNLGSLLALLAYPVLVEPLFGLQAQRVGWTAGYGLFVALVTILAARAWRGRIVDASPDIAPAEPVSWRRRIAWLLLSAAPTSLLLGATQHITADIASAPFLWVAPLALYLAAFIIAFQARPLAPPSWALRLQSGFAPVALLMFTVPGAPPAFLIPTDLLAFLLIALVCTQRLASLRPHPARLTDFYLWVSIGGVAGGAFNAFLAPIVFPAVWEYPLLLVLSGFARPFQGPRLSPFRWGCLIASLISMAVLVAVGDMPREWRIAFLLTPAIAGVLVRDHPPAFVIAMASLAIASYLPPFVHGRTESHRSYFGVVQIGESHSQALGRFRVMVHGSTLHGTQSLEPDRHCRPTTYYAPATPIGQALDMEQAEKPSLNIGAVGLGTGTVAAYVRRTDRLRFYEIDPMVARLSFGDGRFTYVRDCAKGPVSLTLGDARLSLERTPASTFDVLLVDAFSSDSVPVHLMTVEAMRTYLRVIKPDGVVILHLSNRNLELSGPAAAGVRAAGGAMVLQETYSTGKSAYVESAAQVMLAARSRAALERYLEHPQWRPPTTVGRPWTDDYVNVPAAMIDRWKQQHQY